MNRICVDHRCGRPDSNRYSWPVHCRGHDRSASVQESTVAWIDIQLGGRQPATEVTDGSHVCWIPTWRYGTDLTTPRPGSPASPTVGRTSPCSAPWRSERT